MPEGKAVFRPSGSLRRLDADAVRSASAADDLFRQVRAATVSRDIETRLRLTPGKRSVYAQPLHGIPAEESDEEFAAAVEAMS